MEFASASLGMIAIIGDRKVTDFLCANKFARSVVAAILSTRTRSRMPGGLFNRLTNTFVLPQFDDPQTTAR